MGFTESIRQDVLKRADFTCCWCTDRHNKVEVHHIIPRADNGQDTLDNAAPLCGNCHNHFGGNPDFRKEIKLRRNYWYEICEKRLEFSWTPSLHVPLLDSFETTIPLEEKTVTGITVREDWPRFKFLQRVKNDGISPLQVSIGYFPELTAGYKYPRRLSIRVEIPFGLWVNLGVCAESYWDVAGFMGILRNSKDIWMMKGFPDKSSPIDPMYQLRDYLMLIRMNNSENRLVMGAYLPTEARIAIRARVTNDVLMAFADYLNGKGFTKQ